MDFVSNEPIRLGREVPLSGLEVFKQAHSGYALFSELPLISVHRAYYRHIIRF